MKISKLLQLWIYCFLFNPWSVLFCHFCGLHYLQEMLQNILKTTPNRRPEVQLLCLVCGMFGHLFCPVENSGCCG
jgi:hypothetical protein